MGGAGGRVGFRLPQCSHCVQPLLHAVALVAVVAAATAAAAAAAATAALVQGAEAEAGAALVLSVPDGAHTHLPWGGAASCLVAMSGCSSLTSRVGMGTNCTASLSPTNHSKPTGKSAPRLELMM